MLDGSVMHGGQRYAASHGIAFCGQLTTGTTWHGYPIPWRDVPREVRERLIATQQVSEQESVTT
jgi:hypothetical protein